MHTESFYAYCMEKLGAEACFPFDETTLVFKVGGKMFALASLDTEQLRVNLKCDPERAIELRASWSGILPAWHMNKKHWISVYINAGISDALIVSLMQDSYSLVYSTIPKKDISGLQQDSRTLNI